ncbi:MAG: dephospho-CoA kinase [Buchananella hordeovulneris]|nr:dephospho-CoA kinase [Buchananella hordeovulneris]
MGGLRVNKYRSDIFLVGLTGGIGAGKSTVANLCAEAGCYVVSADEVARRVVEAGTGALGEIAAEFGPEVLLPSWELDRPALARLVFGNEQARKRLERILHPRIQAEVTRQIAAFPSGVVGVYDLPLLVETGAADDFDAVMVVEAPLALRLERLSRRGLPPEQATARMQHQASSEERRLVATHLLQNHADVAGLREQLRPLLAVWNRAAHLRAAQD